MRTEPFFSEREAEKYNKLINKLGPVFAEEPSQAPHISHKICRRASGLSVIFKRRLRKIRLRDKIHMSSGSGRFSDHT